MLKIYIALSFLILGNLQAVIPIQDYQAQERRKIARVLAETPGLSPHTIEKLTIISAYQALLLKECDHSNNKKPFVTYQLLLIGNIF